MLAHSDSLKRLLDRLPLNHPRRHFFEMELYRIEAGKRGEKRMRLKFNEFYLAEDFQVIWDVRLKINKWKVQMDGILLTERGAIIIESKNISGKIHFNQETEEFYRIDDEEAKKVLDDPVIQLEKHIRFLKEWFKLNNIKLPVDGLIVFTSKACEFMSKPPGWHVCKTYQMNKYLYNILQTFPQNYASVNLLEIKKMIGENQFPFEQTPLCEHYDINSKDLKTGVSCEVCKKISMKRVLRKWICSDCDHRNSHGHILAMQEYFSLVSTQIDSRRFRHFCGVDSVYVASRMLAEFDLIQTGASKNRKYALKI